jgi:Tfp pilus assembly protein PilO
MNTTLREKILLYVGGVLFGFVIIYVLILKPVYRKHIVIQEKIEQKGKLLDRYKAILKRDNQLKKRVLYIKKEFDKMTKVLLVSTKPSLAASELQGILEDIIKKTRTTITNTRNNSPVEKEAFYQIPIEITVESTLRELKDIIYQIENSDKFLLVRDLNIRLIKPGDPEKLKAKLIIDGFAKKILGE